MRLKFIESDVFCFKLKREFGLAVSTYDAINQLVDKKALAGLKRWNGMHVEDTEEILLIFKGIFDVDQDEVITMATGFAKDEDERYSRFVVVVYHYFYSTVEVKKILNEIGWRKVYFARVEDLNKNIENPEKEDRIFIVAKE